jgi:coenzyme F420-reducing hydrogenase gamma subunit
VSKPRLATVWLAGCSGCHMSFLDLDEWLIELAEAVDLVYSPIADVKEFPEGVDITLVEGAVANADNLELLKTVRERSKIVISFGDCAVHGNVSAMRNPLGDPGVLVAEAYKDAVTALHGQLPNPGTASCPPCCRACWRPTRSSTSTPSCPAAPRRPTASVPPPRPSSAGQSPELAPEQRRFG